MSDNVNLKDNRFKIVYNESWVSLDIGNKETEFDCIRELMVKCMEDLGFEGEFSLPEVLGSLKYLKNNS